MLLIMLTIMDDPLFVTDCASHLIMHMHACIICIYVYLCTIMWLHDAYDVPFISTILMSAVKV